MKNVTVILPIHKWDEDYKLMFENAVKSVEEFYNDVKLTIVGPKDVISNIQLVSDKLETKVLTNDGSSDFCSQVNLGIENCDTEWFSILEVDAVIKEQGKLKENIKLTFGYEFLLRLTHNNVLVISVPKIGYQHVNFRENSLFWSYKNDDSMRMSENEVKFWLDTAKKEFFFKNKREINYVES